MKQLVFSTLFATQLQCAVDNSTGNDIQHIVFFGAVSAITSQVAYDQYDISPTYSALLGWSTAVLMGLGKEYLIDTNVDPRDMRSNVIGATIGIIPMFKYKF